MSNITPLEMDYTNRDFASIRTFLVSAARGFIPEWISAGEPADFGTLLLELYAYVGDGLNYYIDRVAAEPFLATAVRRQSILGIADMLGYVPISQQAASGAITFALADGYNPGTLEIPGNTVVQTATAQSQAAVSFETIGTAYLTDTTRTYMVGAREGRTITNELLALSTGAPLQEYVLHYTGVIHRSATIRVRETDQLEPLRTDESPLILPWSYVDNLVDTDPDASVYTTYLDDRGFLHVVFGDNVAGRIPPVGSEIFVNYRYGVGARGNVAPGTISLITPPISRVSVNNTTTFLGGADNESIDSMRHAIPRAAKLKERAITLQDFADLAFQVPGVAKAIAIGEFYTQVKVYVAPVGGGPRNSDLIANVQRYLEDRTLVGVTVEMHPSDDSDEIYTDVEVEMCVHVLPQYGQLTVKNAVMAAITRVFSFDNPDIDFGCLISRGAVYHAALGVQGVDWIELTKLYPLDDDGNQVGTALVQDIQAPDTRIPISDADHITIEAEGGLT